MDRAILMVEMSVGDLALIYQLAKNDKTTVNDWIMRCVMEKVERLQEEWQMKQRIKPAASKPDEAGSGKGGEG
ncbi:MAG: hypothetical protein QXR74_07380 [Candidatus Bathyarchaeia archaeon]